MAGEPEETSEEVDENLPLGDFNNRGNPLVEGDTAYPVYVDQDGNIRHAVPGTTIEEETIPNLDTVSTHEIHLRIKKAKGSRK